MLHQIPAGYRLASKYPEWVVLVVTKDAAGRVNVMPAGWAMFAASEPLLFAIAIARNHYTHELIEKHGEFVIAVPAPGMEEAIRAFGSCSGRKVDKLAACPVPTAPAAQVKPPLLVGARANLECVLHSRAEAGDHTIFVGRIVAAHEDDAVPGRLMNWGDNLFALAVPAPKS